MTEPSHKRARTERQPGKPSGVAAKVQRIAVPSAPVELESFARIDWALRKIMKETKQYHGKYPYSHRAPTIREVLFRAGLSNKYLENQNGAPYREELKSHYKKKIKRVLRRIKTGRYRSLSPGQQTSGNRSDSTSWSFLHDRLRSLKQKWVEEELEYIDARNRIQELEGKIRELTEENERLRTRQATSNIHVLRRPSDQ